MSLAGGGFREIAATVKATSPPLVDGDLGSTALYAKGVSASRPKRGKKPKPPRFCDHYQRTGHAQDQCSKLIGYPHWYDGSRETPKGRKGTKLAATVTSQSEPVVNSLLDGAGSSKMTGQFDPSML